MIKRLAIIFCLFATALLATQSVKTVNGLAIASVKTMDQLAIASVKTVNGLDNTSGGGGGLPIDSYSSDLLAAYSVPRRLLTSYTGNLIKIRRSSDDTTSDIGYNGSNELDTSAISTFVSSNSAYIHTIYDQSGNGNNLVSTTNSLQMRIVNSGTLDTLASKPVAYNANGVNGSGYSTATFTTYTGTTISCFARGLSGSEGYVRFVSLTKDSANDDSAASVSALLLMDNGTTNWRSYRSGFYGSIATPGTSDGLISVIADGTNNIMRDGTNTSTVAISTAWNINTINLGNQRQGVSGIGSGSKCSELVLWTSDQTANEAAIRSALTY